MDNPTKLSSKKIPNRSNRILVSDITVVRTLAKPKEQKKIPAPSLPWLASAILRAKNFAGRTFNAFKPQLSFAFSSLLIVTVICSAVAISSKVSATGSSTGTLTIINNVTNSYGGTATAGNFTVSVSATNPSQNNFASSGGVGTSITLDPGDYSVSVTGPTGYSSQYDSGCNGTISDGDADVCNITSNDLAGQLRVTTAVTNSNGGTKQSSDFQIQITGTTADPASFSGSDSAAIVTLNPGVYNADVADAFGYSTSTTGDCSGSISGGQIKLCTINLQDPAPSPTPAPTVTPTPAPTCSGDCGGGSDGTTSTSTLLSITTSGDGSGTITSADDNINCGTICSFAYASGTSVTLTAWPNINSTFTDTWSGACSGNNPVCTIIVSGGMVTVNANFSPAPVSGGGIGGSSGNGSSGGGFSPAVILPVSTAAPTPALVLLNFTAPIPTGIVLGASTTKQPVSQVLGAETSLPRTGVPYGSVLFILLAPALFVSRKKLAI